MKRKLFDFLGKKKIVVLTYHVDGKHGRKDFATEAEARIAGNIAFKQDWCYKVQIFDGEPGNDRNQLPRKKLIVELV